MKSVVAFDSVHGSTRRAAEAIAEELRSDGHEAQLIFVREPSEGPLEGDLLFIGSPTRGGKMTKATSRFISSLDLEYWKSREIAIFDTLGPLSKDPQKRRKMLEAIKEPSKTAASRMKDMFAERGVHVSKVMHFAVVGMWGPLAPDSPERAKELTRDFLAELQSGTGSKTE